MNVRLVAVCASLVLTSTALAQDDGFGLDLTQENETKEEPKQDETQPAQEPAASTVLDQKVKAASDDVLIGERDITQDDRVKSVQRKVYLKKNRFEVSPSVVASINDPFYSKVGIGARGGYYFADTLAVMGRVTLMQVLPTEDVRTAKRTFQSRIFSSVPLWSAMGDVEWSPIYGKVTIFNSILHFDGYILGGLGLMVTETSARPDRGAYIAGDLGVGMRFVVKDFLAVNVALINTSYVEQPAGTTKGATQNLMTVNAGISLFLPLRSTGRESE